MSTGKSDIFETSPGSGFLSHEMKSRVIIPRLHRGFTPVS